MVNVIRFALFIASLGAVCACGGEPTPAQQSAPTPSLSEDETLPMKPEPTDLDAQPSPSPQRPEPVGLELAGWSRRDAASEFPNESIFTLRQGDASVELARWWGVPEIDGGPMQVASKRPVQVPGQTVELSRTSMFEGEQAEVDLLFLRGDGWIVRVVCRSCTEQQVDAVCAGLTLAG